MSQEISLTRPMQKRPIEFESINAYLYDVPLKYTPYNDPGYNYTTSQCNTNLHGQGHAEVSPGAQGHLGLGT